MPREFFYSNTLGVFNLLEAFKKFYKKYKQTKLIHISTDEVYGDVLKGRSTETWPYKPSSPYAASKASLIILYFLISEHSICQL